MSISQLFTPNSFNLHCASITADLNIASNVNLVVNNQTSEVVLTSGLLNNIYPTSITLTNAANYVKVGVTATIWADITPGNIIFFRLRRGATIIYSTNIGAISGVLALQYQLPISFTFYDEPGITNPSYNLEIENLSDNTCYLTKNGTNTSTQITLEEVTKQVLSYVSSNNFNENHSESSLPPEYSENSRTSSKSEKGKDKLK